MKVFRGNKKTIWYKISESNIFSKDACVSTISKEQSMSDLRITLPPLYLLSNRKRKKPYTKSLDCKSVPTMSEEKLQSQNVFQNVPIALNSSKKEIDNSTCDCVTKTLNSDIKEEVEESTEAFILPKEEQEIKEEVFDDFSTEHHSFHEDRTKLNVISNCNIDMESDGGEGVSQTVEKSDFPLPVVSSKEVKSEPNSFFAMNKLFQRAHTAKLCDAEKEPVIKGDIFDDFSKAHHSIPEDRTKLNVISNPNIDMDSNGGEDNSQTVGKRKKI